MMKKNRDRQINLKIYLISLVFFFLFAAMCVYFVWFNLTKQTELFNNTFNSRQEMMEEQNIRGSIFSADGEKLAYTITNEDQTEERVYPYKELFSHVVGYSDYGKSGIEALANYELIHSNVTLNNKVSSSLSGTKLLADNVYITLDASLQEVVSKALGVYDGAVVVTEVKTGRILAMVSKPDFDPNEIEELLTSLKPDDKSSVLLNRATQGLYPPGSIFKIVTTLEYLREHDNDLSGYSYQCSGSYRLGDIKIKCFGGTVHGYLDYEDSVTNSCNCSFANIGVGLDLDAFADTLDDLLFNQELPIDLPSNISSYDLVGDGTKEAIIQSSFGQGKTIVTPLQMNVITCAIANDGILMKPQVLDCVKSADGVLVKKYSSTVYGRLMTSEESSILAHLMTRVVEVGTASKLNNLPYTVAGKTGSAEYDSSKINSHSWFTGFAPVEDPEIAVTVIMEEAGTGSSYAVPVAKRILDAYFDMK